MINFTKQLPQNTTVIQSKPTEQYSKSSNQQRHLEAAFDIHGAPCISDAVFINIIFTMTFKPFVIRLMAPFLNITFDRPFFLFIYDALNKVRNKLTPPMIIPHICHFFYTVKNFGQKILHRRMRKLRPTDFATK